MKVTMFEVNGSHTQGRQIHPEKGNQFGSLKTQEIIQKANIKVAWGSSGVRVTPANGRENLLVRLPPMERPDLIRRVEAVVTTWFPDLEEALVIFDPNG